MKKPNIPAYASTQQRLLLKFDAFKSFNTILDILTEEQQENYKTELSVLYLKFVKPLPKKVNLDIPMQVLAKFVGKKDVRYQLNYIYSTGTSIVASNGHMLAAYDTTEFPVGFYDPKTLVHVGDLDGTKYPDFGRVWCQEFKPVISLSSASEVRDMSESGKAYRYVELGGLCFNYDYMSLLISIVGDDADCAIAENNSALKITLHGGYAFIVMPMRV